MNQNIRNDASDDENEQETDIVNVNIGSETVQIRYYQLCKHSQLIQDHYLIADVRSRLSSEIQSCQQNYSINNDNTILFFQFLKEQNVQISGENYRSFTKLAHFLKAKKIIKKLKSFLQAHRNDVNFHIQIILEEINLNNHEENDRSDLIFQSEQCLVDRINECFQNENFHLLPISLIYRLIALNDIDDINDNHLLDFIINSINKHYVLFQFLQIQNLSYDKFNELYRTIINLDDELKKKCIQFIPCSLYYLKNLIEMNNQHEMHISEIENEKNELLENQNQLNEVNTQLQTLIESIEDEKDQLNEQKNIIQQKLNEYKSKESSKKSDIKRPQSNYNQLIEENKKLKEIINNLEKKNVEFQSIISRLKIENDRTKGELQITKKQNENFHQQLSEIQKNTTKKEKELSDKIKIIETENKSYKSKINSLMISSEHFSEGINNILKNENEFNLKNGIHYLELSSYNGNCFASFILGILYENGIIVDK